MKEQKTYPVVLQLTPEELDEMKIQIITARNRVMQKADFSFTKKSRALYSHVYEVLDNVLEKICQYQTITEQEEISTFVNAEKIVQRYTMLQK